MLDGIDPLPRDPYGPFRLPVMDRHRDMGTIVMGKSEAGIVQVGDKLKMMPNKTVVKVPAGILFERRVSKDACPPPIIAA